MNGLAAMLSRLMDDERGASAVEYGLLAALIAVGAILSFVAMGGGLSNLFGTTTTGAGGRIESAAQAASS